MSRHFDNERALQHEIESVLGEALPGIEVLDVELDEPQERVRVFIDHADGIGFEECEAVTHAIRDTCPDHELEVSSPGIERPLRSPASFTEVVGEPVRLRRAGSHRAGLFTVAAVDEQGVHFQSSGGEPLLVPFDEIIRCRLVVEDVFAVATGKAARKTKKRGRS
jgi:ribosome maturation factor RimP